MSKSSQSPKLFLDSSRIIDAANKPKPIEIGGHYVEYNSSFTKFECTRCDSCFEVPEIFQASVPFNQVLYQLHIIGHYRHYTCPKTQRNMKLYTTSKYKPSPDPVHKLNSGNIYYHSANAAKASDNKTAVETLMKRVKSNKWY